MRIRLIDKTQNPEFAGNATDYWENEMFRKPWLTEAAKWKRLDEQVSSWLRCQIKNWWESEQVSDWLKQKNENDW